VTIERPGENAETPQSDSALLARMAAAEKYGADFFRTRQGNDPLRLEAFAREKRVLERHLTPETFRNGNVLDIGCSTGEFLRAIDWPMSHAWGMEISDFAKAQAKSSGISFDKDVFSETDFFDLVVLRGTIQYLPSPFEYLYAIHRCLKPGGFLFLTAPNTNSPYYRLFKTLPFLEEDLHFWIPCDTSLRMVLRNCGFRRVEITYPYLESPYAKPVRDHLRFVAKLLFRTRHRFPFWRNIMHVMAQK
jgi:SAM-dependent methyltransferase